MKTCVFPGGPGAQNLSVVGEVQTQISNRRTVRELRLCCSDTVGWKRTNHFMSALADDTEHSVRRLADACPMNVQEPLVE